MQQTSDLYKSIISGDHRKEVRLRISEYPYDMDQIVSLRTTKRVFSGDTPSVGDCIAGEIHVKMFQPDRDIPRQAKLVPQVRVTDGTRYSEWIQKGLYYIDTRSTDNTGSNKWLTLTGFDAMLKAEQDYPASRLSWPAKDIDVVTEIARAMGVAVDSRTRAFMTAGYKVEYPAGYSQREVLGYIGAMYAGSWIMNDIGQLRLITMYSIPKETNVLIDRLGNAITIGGVRIRV